MDERNEFLRDINNPDLKDGVTKYESLFFPDLGTMTITYETLSDGTKAPVISLDFIPTDRIRIIDQYGDDREIQ